MTTITKEQKEVIDSVLSIFETGRVPTPASYSTCAILTDGAGISYGKHQATDRAGSLDKIVDLYIQQGGKHGEELRQFVPKLSANESAKVDPKSPPSWAKYLMGVLKEAGKDPVMQASQDAIFDSAYWMPAVGLASGIGLKTALGNLVVYDTCIHSGPGGVAVIRARFPEPSPKNGGDEKSWVTAYISARRTWLAGNSNPLVQKTVYRMDALMDIVKSGNWDLTKPLVVRGVKIA
jgi:chitosanase